MKRPFVDRDADLAALREQLNHAREASPRIVLIDGPPGIGKTALIDHFLADSTALQVLQVYGDDSEALLPFAVVDQLFHQARIDAREMISGLYRVPTGADHLSAGAQILEVLGVLQEAGTVVLVIDDAQWADSQSLRAFLFAFRRLAADRVLTLIATRSQDLPRLPEGLRRLAERDPNVRLTLRALDPEQLRELAERMGVGKLSVRAAQRLYEHTEGNPLHARALLSEWPEEVVRATDAPLPAPRSLETMVEHQIESCSAVARSLLEAAAVLGVRTTLSDAARLGGVDDALSALDEAMRTGLIEMRQTSAGLTITLPDLIRAAIYQRLGPGRRAALHRAAGELVGDDWTRLRHRAASVVSGDEALAAELEEFAAREAERGAWGRSSSSLAAASRISVIREEAVRRLLHAIDSMLYAGDVAQAATFADEIAGYPGGPLRDCVLGFLAMLNSRPYAAERLLLNAWEQCDEKRDPQLAATIARRVALHYLYRLRGPETVSWSQRALELGGKDPPRRHAELLGLGLGLAYASRSGEGMAAVEAALRRVNAGEYKQDVSLRRARGWLRLLDGDLVGAQADLRAEATEATRVGSLGTAAFAFAMLAQAEYRAGHWDDSVVHGERALTVTSEMEHSIFRALAVMAAVAVPAARGDWTLAEAHLRAAPVVADDYEHNVAALGIARAHLAAARGNHAAVLRATDPLLRITPREGIDEPGCWPWQDLRIDALISVERLDDAMTLLNLHEPRAAARGRQLMIGKLARSRGRLHTARGDHDGADQAFAIARQQLADLRAPFEVALVELAWGQALRRRGHRRAASAHLTAARNSFAELLAHPFLERCDAELLACGAQPVRRSDLDLGGLTPQELSVARLVASGLTNREVASELVLSVRTIESHLTRIYSKLEVSSRAQLAALASRSRAPATT
jgi:ATP/maltotriose-dependent transcriptional regulator MalT